MADGSKALDNVLTPTKNCSNGFPFSNTKCDAQNFRPPSYFSDIVVIEHVYVNLIHIVLR